MIRGIIYFVIIVMFQTLVVNQIHLFGIVTPFIYIYILLKIRIDMSRSFVIVLSFLLGLIIDIFSNTPGIHAAACTFIGFIRKPLSGQFVDLKELPDRSVPSFGLFGFSKFFRYALILTAIHHTALFLIESFSFYQPWLMFTRMTSSILLSLLLIFIIEAFNPGNKRKWRTTD